MLFLKVIFFIFCFCYINNVYGGGLFPSFAPYFFVQFRHDILVVCTAAAGVYLRERVFVHDAFHHLLATGRCGQPDIFLVGIREESHGGANPPVV